MIKLPKTHLNLYRGLLPANSTLKFSQGTDTSPTQEIDCIAKWSFLGILKKLFRKEKYTSIKVQYEDKGFDGKKHEYTKTLLIRNKTISTLIGKENLPAIQKLPSKDRLARLNQAIILGSFDFSSSPLKKMKSLDSLSDDTSSTITTSTSNDSTWKNLSLEVETKLKSLIPLDQISEEDLSAFLKNAQNILNSLLKEKKSSVFSYVEVKIGDNTQKILIGRHHRKLIIEKIDSQSIGKGSFADIYKSDTFAIKQHLETCWLDADKEVQRSINPNTIRDEIEGCQAVSEISGTLKVYGPLVDPISLQPIGFVTNRYKGNFSDYLLQSLKHPNRANNLVKNFSDLATVFDRMHQRDLVHNDITIKNVFVNYSKGNISKFAVGDIQKTDLTDKLFTTATSSSFYDDHIRTIKACSPGNEKQYLAMRKKLDVRQFVFFMYYSFCSEQENEEIKLNGPFSLDDRAWPDPASSYRPIPEEKAPEKLRTYIQTLLTTENLEDLPSMEEVQATLTQIIQETTQPTEVSS